MNAIKETVVETKILKDNSNIIPGFIVAVTIGFISIFIGGFVPKIGSAPIAIFLGIVIGNLVLNDKKYQEGYKFSESNLLSYAIVLLGATLSISTLAQLGLSGILFIVFQMSITIIGVILVGRKLGFKEDFVYLMAAGNAVCGSSAIAATAPAIGAEDKDKGISITIVNVIGIFLMFILPLLAQLLYQHDLVKTSGLIGGTLQSVGQVVASGAIVSEEVKDLATIFKIVRVIFLVVVVLILGNLKNKSNEKNIETRVNQNKKAKMKVPWYVFGFFITCILFSIGIISPEVSHICKEISNKFEIIALAAIGLRVNIKDLIKQGKVVSIYATQIAVIQITSAIVLISIFL